MVWILEWAQPAQSESNVTLWSSCDEARQQACYEILMSVADWDLSDEDWKERATNINDAVSVKDYSQAIGLYNEWEAEGDYEYMQQYHVYERQIQNSPQTPQLLIISDPDDEGEEEEDEDEDNYIASTPGATCRGPSCGYYSPDAYADRRDGTFCCYQCKMMSQVFGGKVP